ncbi:MAG: MoaD/ThiS family protein [Cyanobacteria bacterium]|nr:MoaD/ThiS family protein [Cyanobacteriota bacterium]
MIVHIPSPLRSYTNKESSVEGSGSNLAEILHDLDKRFPGIRFRMIDEQDGIRRHIKLFVNNQEALDLKAAVTQKDVVHIICALSGG